MAPARSVAVGYSAGAVGKLNADGWAVLDAAVGWADGNPLVPVAGVTSFDFDAFEQLRSVTPPSPATASSYSYDALGRRRTAPSGPLAYAGTDIQPSSDGAYRYGWGPGGTVAVDDMASGGGVWAHADGHTDVVGTFTPGATALASSQTFSPWGQPLGATGSPLPLGYQSERTDLPGGLVPMGVREYNPETATFISRDPAHDPSVPNNYSYTPSNPLAYTDPTGMGGCPLWDPDWPCHPKNVGKPLGKVYVPPPQSPPPQPPPPPPPPTPPSGEGASSGGGGSSSGGSSSGRSSGGGGGGPAPNPHPTNCNPCGGQPPGSADAPPPPVSDLEWQVAGGQPAISNYPGRVQRDRSNGNIVDTGLSGIHGPSDAHVTINTPPLPASPNTLQLISSNRPGSEPDTMAEALENCAERFGLDECPEGDDGILDVLGDFGNTAVGMGEGFVGAISAFAEGVWRGGVCTRDKIQHLIETGDYPAYGLPGACHDIEEIGESDRR